MVGFWNLRPMPRWAISGSDMRRTSMFWSNITLPRSARVLPVMTSIMVVLPAPFGPITARISPRSITKDSAFRARNPSKVTVTPSRYSSVSPAWMPPAAATLLDKTSPTWQRPLGNSPSMALRRIPALVLTISGTRRLRATPPSCTRKATPCAGSPARWHSIMKSYHVETGSPLTRSIVCPGRNPANQAGELVSTEPICVPAAPVFACGVR